MIRDIKVAWLCPYPLSKIERIPVAYRKRTEHPSTWIVTLADELSKVKDVELHIVSEFTNISKSFDCIQNNIHFHCLRSALAIPFLCRGYAGMIPYDAFSQFKKSRHNLRKKISEISPDIVHAHGTEGPNGIVAVESNYPHIISLQGIVTKLVEINPNYRYRKIALLEKEVLRRGKNFIAKTAFAKEIIRKYNPEAAVFHIDNIVHPSFFKVARNGRLEKNIVYAGAISPDKGVKELINAFGKISPEYPDYFLTLIGGGSEKYLQHLKNFAESLKVDGRIRWLGFQTHTQIAETFRKAAVLTFPSKMDTSPNVVAEAMVSGLPVIATSVGGIPDMIKHRETGYLINQPTAPLIYEALKKVLSDVEFCHNIGKNGQDEARIRFSREANLDKIIKAYRSILF